MPVLEPISPQKVEAFKATRLQALYDSPGAFGSTYAREFQLSDADWLKRAHEWNNSRCVGYLAMDREKPCGIAASFLDEENLLQAQLVSMWVAPSHRRAGLGWTLIAAILEWAHQNGALALHLTVTSNNHPAIAFYERHGFAKTGKTLPYPNDPHLFEYEMARPVTIESSFSPVPL